jgi:hypothetical protein
MGFTFQAVGHSGSLVFARALEEDGDYGWIPHNASFGFLDLTPSIVHSNWFWDYIS